MGGWLLHIGLPRELVGLVAFERHVATETRERLENFRLPPANPKKMYSLTSGGHRRRLPVVQPGGFRGLRFRHFGAHCLFLGPIGLASARPGHSGILADRD